MTELVQITADGRTIDAPAGSNLLSVCLANDIYIPNLCHMEGLTHPTASCRMCFVEIEGIKGPVASCATTVRPGMVVRTDTPDVRRLQKTALRLLFSVHDISCKTCPANRKCALQDIAKFLKIALSSKPFEKGLKDPAVNDGHPIIGLFVNRCVLCGKCIQTCRMRHGKSFLAFAKRGFDTVITFHGADEIDELPCAECLECVTICPVAAIVLKSEREKSHKEAK